MKVLLLVTEHEDYTVAFASGLSRHASVVVGTPRRQYAGLADWFDSAVDLRLLDWPRHRSLSNPRFLLSLTRLVRRERPDVVHLLSHTTLWLNLALPFWRPIPLVTTVHDVDVHPGDAETRVLPEWAPSLVVRQSGDIVVHGEGLRQRAVERYAKPPDRVHVLSHPPNLRYPVLARREGLVRRPGDAFTVLMFGRIMAYKGLAQLIQAEAALAERIPNLRVVIAGRGGDPWEFRALMGDPGRYDIRNRFIEDREVAQLFLDADVVALPYVEASQSGVLNIAAAFGRPVVATDVGEFRATVETHRLGLVVPPGDLARLAEAIALLAARPALAAELGASAHAWAEGPNAPEAIGAAATALYRAIASRDVRLGVASTAGRGRSRPSGPQRRPSR
jgi:glycosyltransferase involved in cell wall biosynthesis